MMPLYGFLEGDTIGLIILGEPSDTASVLADKLQSAASVRVAPREGMVVLYKGRVIGARATLAEAGFAPLERFDVVVGAG